MSPKYIAWISFSMTIGAIAALDLYLPAAPFLADYFGVSEAVMKMTFMVSPLSSCLSGIPFGYYSDRIGRKPMLILALAMFLMGTLTCALAPDITVFFVGRILQALGAGGVLVINGALLADIFTGVTLARYLGIYASFFPLVYALAPVAGAFILEQLGWRWIFGFNLILVALSSLVIIRYVPETLKKFGDADKKISGIIGHFAQMFQSPGMVMLCAIHALPICFGAMFSINSSFLYINLFLFTPLAYSIVQATPVTTQFMGAQIYKSVVGRMGIRNSMGVGLATTSMFSLFAIVMLGGVVPIDPYFLVAAVTLFSMGSTFMISSAATLVLDRNTEDKGLVMSFLSFIRNLMISVILWFSSIFTCNSAESIIGFMLMVAAVQALFVWLQMKRMVENPQNLAESRPS